MTVREVKEGRKGVAIIKRKEEGILNQYACILTWFYKGTKGYIVSHFKFLHP